MNRSISISTRDVTNVDVPSYSEARAMEIMELQDSSLLRNEALIGGKWVTSRDDNTFDVTNPATSTVIAKIPDLGADDCTQAVKSASNAAATLRAYTGMERSRILRNWYHAMIVAQDDIAALITAENGKPKGEALGEVAYAANFLDWFADEARRIGGQLIGTSNRAHRVVTLKQPVGVVSIITPWNFPAAMVTRKAAAAIAAGCPCIIKPAAETPLTALALAALSQRAGLPPGAINVVTTFKHVVEVGKVLTQHLDIRKFSFTGSTTVGKMLAAQCMSTVKRVSLELGGNAPFIIFEDADIEQAVEGLMKSKFRLSGQTCVCANRVYVQKGILPRVAEAVAAQVKRLRVGDGSRPQTTIGPLISPRAVTKVSSHITDALDLGAKVLCGGDPASELGEAFFQPTVLIDVAPDSLCAREETFGPLLPIIAFDSESEVVNLANQSSVGLAGYFYTKDSARAWRVAEALEVGMVGINTGIISDAASPFGGIKESGLGREGGHCGIDEYLEVCGFSGATEVAQDRELTQTHEQIKTATFDVGSETQCSRL